jgi:hypothetical protein
LRELAIVVRVWICALAAFATVRPLWSLSSGDYAIAVCIQPREHLCRMRQEFFARDVAVIVGVGTAEHMRTAAATTSMAATLCAPFVACEFAVIVGVQLRKTHSARRIELGPRHRAVAICVGLEKTGAAFAWRTRILSQRQASSSCERRKTNGGE